MIAFRVWVRWLGGGSRVRVEGTENASWLLGRLSQSFVFKSSEPIRLERDGLSCTFEVPYSSQTSRSTFERLLATIPEVKLLAEPL
jgi:hypothetical protein